MIDLSFDVWKNILLALAVAFVISFVATPVVSSFAKKVGAIDIPDKKRRAWAALRYSWASCCRCCCLQT